MTKKFFFMAVMTANLEGRALASVNTINAIDTRNITAAVLGNIQDGGAAMCQQQGLMFDNIVIQNIFFLGEMTQEEFTANTILDPNVAAEQLSDALAQSMEPSADVHLEPANPVLEPRMELAVDNTGNAGPSADSTKNTAPVDGSEQAAQAIEETPADTVTTADVVGEQEPFAEGDDKPAA